MGMLNELYACRVALGENEAAAEIKKQIVRENIYGVDIEKGAVDIARLRFWLAIIVDERAPIPLPNLDYKIMQGNSLLESFEGEDLSNLIKESGNLFDNVEIINNLIKALHGYYLPNDAEAKRKIKKQIFANVLSLLKERGLPEKVIQKLEHIDLSGNSEFFLWHTWFSDVFGPLHYINAPEIDVLNSEIDSINAQIQTLNKALKNKLNKIAVRLTKLTVFQAVEIENEISSVKMDLEKLYGHIRNSITEIEFVGTETEVVQLKKVNNKIECLNKDLSTLEEILPKKYGSNSGFDVVIGNPPYGANIDSLVKTYEKLYPETSHGFKDIYKYFYNQGLNLVKPNGIVTYITPSTFLRQPRYGDLRRLMLKNKICQLLDLGEEIFVDAVVPVAIGLIQKSNKIDYINFIDLTKKITIENYEKLLYKPLFKEIEQSDYNNTQNNIFIENIVKRTENQVLLDDVLSFKDAGINYQRTKVGLHEKGKSDLSSRLLYEGKKEKPEHVEFWKGSDIDSYFMSEHTNRYCRPEIKLKEGEHITLNSDYFAICPKLIWRQTAQFPIATIDKTGRWFGRSIQAGIIKSEYKDIITYEYLCALLNSKYLRYLYEQNVKETGRVFPQVKLEKLKPLPIIIPTLIQQQSIIALVDEILAAKKADKNTDTSDLEAQIDTAVYTLYRLSAEEIAAVEGKQMKK